MKYQNPAFTYFIGDEKFTDRCEENANFELVLDVSDAFIKAKVIAKKKITMHRFDLNFEYRYKEGDRFYSNGYQSWTTSREYGVCDRMRDIIPIAKGRLKNLAGISADCRFVDFPTAPGKFISHCYTYVKNGRDLTLVGSLTERQGFTVFYTDMTRDTFTLSKDVEGVTLIPGEEYALFDVVILSGAYDAVFDEYFKRMGVQKPVIDHMSGYTSWYNYFQKIDEKIILRDLNALDIV